ncbi:aminopeptidase N [Hoyosella rhizosphaerae]|uniref:Aminopeptidase N n=1 Tax=Hoyosella rhizosphaerae TaxID=1755582 RepID=A0A916UHG5_9ACTN|nr:aminopeptidase N [Hoyosella rhizosphaerae]MBN4928114.1 aminopeptidase N [Hoyosella rhizosphaerae]GGC72491.1 aminopeptidase [Hoyosella rhizosphaerae]
MAAPNLTRDQARARAADVKVDNYTIEVDLTDGNGNPSEKTFRTKTTVTFAGTPGASTFVDLIVKTIHHATLNGNAVDVSAYDDAHGLPLPELEQNNELVIDAEFLYSHTGEGLHRFVDPTDNEVYLFSQFQTADAKRVFACFDQPDIKATFDVSVTAPAHWAVITNGAEISRSGLTRTFAQTPRMSTYIAALVAGPYSQWTDVYRDEHGEIPLGIFCRASLAEHMDADRLFTETKQGFEFYHRNFGIPYPFGKYDQLFVPEFNAGAMENAGAVTYLEDYVFRSRVTRSLYERRAETVLHEMAHMWFGDLVTMEWWDDLWLNESFATFASVLCQAEATEYTNAWTSFANVEKAWAYRQDQLPSTHPIAADIPDEEAVAVNFDGITYAKGASVLKQLVAYVGLEDFLAGLRAYFKEHAYGNATFSDLLTALEAASGRDLSDWGNQWLKTTGLNTLRPEFTVDSDGNFASFSVIQGGAQPGAGETRTHRLAVGVYGDDGSGKLVRINRVELDISGDSTDVPDLVGTPQGELVLVNDDDLTYCSLRLDDSSLTTLIDRIGDIADSLPRTLAWSAAWEMTRNAEMRARDFAALVARGIGAETEVGVVQRLLLQAATAIGSYAEPDWANSTGAPEFADMLLQHARNAEAGSDHQLAFVNALCAAKLEARHADAVSTLLNDGPDAVDLAGLVVDTDLRWRLIQALAAAGRIDAESEATPRIDEEIERDNTATGARQGAQAAALRPLPAAKAHVWDRVVNDDSTSHTMARSMIAGFSPVGQAHLLTDYADKFFAAIPDIWKNRSGEVAQTIVTGLYPTWDISVEGLERADKFLAGEHSSALRRLVLEGRAGIERSLKAREFDGS